MSSSSAKTITFIKRTSNNKDRRRTRDSKLNLGEGRPDHDHGICLTEQHAILDNETRCKPQHEPRSDDLWLNKAQVLHGGVSSPSSFLVVAEFGRKHFLDLCRFPER